MAFALPLSLLLAAVPAIDVPVTRAELPNGMKVIIAPDRTVPGVTINLLYDVGSKDEQPGRTGFAHLFEHLMFMGARYVPYPQFDTLMEAGGGTNNASTSDDVTDYFSVGPSNLLETFLWMESDRLLTLGQEMTQEKLETQREGGPQRAPPELRKRSLRQGGGRAARRALPQGAPLQLAGHRLGRRPPRRHAPGREGASSPSGTSPATPAWSSPATSTPPRPWPW